MNDNFLRMTLLFDYYGELLTDKQREYFDYYYNDDLSLAEIAGNVGITRQGVRDIIVRAEATLRDTEKRLGLVERFEKMSVLADRAEKLASELESETTGSAREKSAELRRIVGEMKGQV